MPAPTGAVRLSSISENLSRTTAHGNLLQPASHEKSQPLAIGREEGVDGPLCAGNGLGVQAIHRPQVKLLGATLAGDIGEKSAIGRKGHSRTTIQTCQLL